MSLLIPMNCTICNKELTGKQQKFCCQKCKNQGINKKYNGYQCQQKRGLDRKLYFVKQLGGKCVECGYNKNLAVLTFHHTDPNVKEIKLDMRTMSNNSLETLQKEILKCKLMCHNCHMELHHPTLKMVGPEGFEPPTPAL